MKTMYAVQGDSLIDGGAPGYFAIAFFDNKEDADTLCEILNKYRKEFMEELSSNPKMKDIDKIRAWGEKQKKIKCDNKFSYGLSDMPSRFGYVVSKVYRPDNVSEVIQQILIGRIRDIYKEEYEQRQRE